MAQLYAAALQRIKQLEGQALGAPAKSEVGSTSERDLRRSTPLSSEDVSLLKTLNISN